MPTTNLPKNAPRAQGFVKVREIKNGTVILQDNSMKAVCICSSMNFDLLSTTEQEAVINRFQEFLNSLDFSIQIIVASRHFEIDTYLDQIREMEKNRPMNFCAYRPVNTSILWKASWNSPIL